MAGAPKNNKNAEKWTEEEALNLFDEAIEMASSNSDYDFIGEVARDLGTYREIFVYLKDKFNSCKHKYKLLVSNLEANCFSHTKKGEINTAVGIVNLKSNHGWTDRAETTLQGGDKPIQTTELTAEQAASIAKEMKNKY